MQSEVRKVRYRGSKTLITVESQVKSRIPGIQVHVKSKSSLLVVEDQAQVKSSQVKSSQGKARQADRILKILIKKL